MQTLRVNHLCKMLALFLVIFTAGVAAASEDIHRFQQALTLHPDQLEERFPIVVDWIRQDGGPEWQRIVSGETAHLPLIVARIIDQLDALDVATDDLRSRLEKKFRSSVQPTVGCVPGSCGTTSNGAIERSCWQVGIGSVRGAS